MPRLNRHVYDQTKSADLSETRADLSGLCRRLCRRPGSPTKSGRARLMEFGHNYARTCRPYVVGARRPAICTAFLTTNVSQLKSIRWKLTFFPVVDRHPKNEINIQVGCWTTSLSHSHTIWRLWRVKMKTAILATSPWNFNVIFSLQRTGTVNEKVLCCMCAIIAFSLNYISLWGWPIGN